MLKYLKPIIILLFLLGSLVNAPAQTGDNTRLQELMQQGKQLMDQEEYQQANLVFRKILTLNIIIPSEFCYYFANTLYQTRQYQNSKNFIKKYYELTGTTGDFYKNVIRLEVNVDLELARISNCNLCSDEGYVLQTCHHCNGLGEHTLPCPYCKEKGKVSCSLCTGEGVLIKTNLFSEKEYHTCHKCEGTGAVTCPTCQGEKTVVQTCSICEGTGKEATNQICHHQGPEKVEAR
ncbi:MAG: molecular chaperone DnaJ [Candidatus Cyclobacteriaceae bacterium M3_2C_046]